MKKEGQALTAICQLAGEHLCKADCNPEQSHGCLWGGERLWDFTEAHWQGRDVESGKAHKEKGKQGTTHNWKHDTEVTSPGRGRLFLRSVLKQVLAANLYQTVSIFRCSSVFVMWIYDDRHSGSFLFILLVYFVKLHVNSGGYLLRFPRQLNWRDLFAFKIFKAFLPRLAFTGQLTYLKIIHLNVLKSTRNDNLASLKSLSLAKLPFGMEKIGRNIASALTTKKEQTAETRVFLNIPEHWCCVAKGRQKSKGRQKFPGWDKTRAQDHPWQSKGRKYIRCHRKH